MGQRHHTRIIAFDKSQADPLAVQMNGHIGDHRVGRLVKPFILQAAGHQLQNG